MIAMMYERGEPLPNDPARLARLCGASNSTFSKALAALIDGGKIVLVEGGLWNDRVQKEQVYRTEKSEVGKQAAEKRWRKAEQNQQQPDASAMPTQSDGNANQKPEPEERSLRSLSGARENFGRFWSIYPKRAGNNPKHPASLKFDAAVRSGVDAEEIIAAAGRYAEAETILGHIGTPYVQQAAVWLNQRGWETYPAGYVMPRAAGPPGRAGNGKPTLGDILQATRRELAELENGDGYPPDLERKAIASGAYPYRREPDEDADFIPGPPH